MAATMIRPVTQASVIILCFVTSDVLLLGCCPLQPLDRTARGFIHTFWILVLWDHHGISLELRHTADMTRACAIATAPRANNGASPVCVFCPRRKHALLRLVEFERGGVDRPSRKAPTHIWQVLHAIVKPVVDAARAEVEHKIRWKFKVLLAQLLEQVKRFTVTVSSNVWALAQDAHPKANLAHVSEVTVHIQAHVHMFTVFDNLLKLALVKRLVKVIDDLAPTRRAIKQKRVLKLAHKRRGVAP